MNSRQNGRNNFSNTFILQVLFACSTTVYLFICDRFSCFPKVESKWPADLFHQKRNFFFDRITRQDGPDHWIFSKISCCWKIVSNNWRFPTETITSIKLWQRSIFLAPSCWCCYRCIDNNQWDTFFIVGIRAKSNKSRWHLPRTLPTVIKPTPTFASTLHSMFTVSKRTPLYFSFQFSNHFQAVLLNIFLHRSIRVIERAYCSSVGICGFSKWTTKV